MGQGGDRDNMLAVDIIMSLRFTAFITICLDILLHLYSQNIWDNAVLEGFVLEVYPYYYYLLESYFINIIINHYNITIFKSYNNPVVFYIILDFNDQ